MANVVCDASGHACVSSVRRQVERAAVVRCSAAALCAIRTRRRRSRRAHRALLKTWQREEGFEGKKRTNDGRDGV